MFCTKCGTQNPEGAGFCVKCGAKLVADNPGSEKVAPPPYNAAGPAQPVGAPDATSSQQTPPQPYQAPFFPQKRKSKAPFIVLGIVGVLFGLFVLVGIIGLITDSQNESSSSRQVSSTAVSSAVTASSEADDKVELTQTYFNSNEGIYFQYPEDWEKIPKSDWDDYLDVSDDALVLLVRDDEDNPALYSMLLVRKFDIPLEDVQETFFSDEETFLELYSDVDIKETSVTKVDTVPAREIHYLDEDGASCLSYFYIAGAYTYKIEIYWLGEDPGDLQQTFDAIMDSYAIDEDKLNKVDAEQTSSDSTATTEYQDMVLYKGIPVESILAAPYDYIIKTFGEPDSSMFGGEEITYGTTEMSFEMFDLEEPYLCILKSTTLEDFTYNGKALTMDFDDLTATFGESPVDNGFGQWCYYWEMMDDVATLTVDPNASYIQISWWDTSNKVSPEIKPVLPYGFEWVEGPTTTADNLYTTIEGVIRNSTGARVSGATITFNMYDEDGNQIGEMSDYITNWENGNTWKFSVNFHCASYEFVSFSAA